MKPKKIFTVAMVYERETPGTRVFISKEKTGAAISALYIRKDALPKLLPKNIIVTVEET